VLTILVSRREYGKYRSSWGYWECRKEESFNECLKKREESIIYCQNRDGRRVLCIFLEILIRIIAFIVCTFLLIMVLFLIIYKYYKIDIIGNNIYIYDAVQHKKYYNIIKYT